MCHPIFPHSKEKNRFPFNKDDKTSMQFNEQVREEDNMKSIPVGSAVEVASIDSVAKFLHGKTGQLVEIIPNANLGACYLVELDEPIAPAKYFSEMKKLHCQREQIFPINPDTIKQEEE